MLQEASKKEISPVLHFFFKKNTNLVEWIVIVGLFFLTDIVALLQLFKLFKQSRRGS
jgi:hypothetical protein